MRHRIIPDGLTGYQQDLRTALRSYEHAIELGNIAYRDLKAKLALDSEFRAGIDLDRAAIDHPETKDMERQVDTSADRVFASLTRYLKAFERHMTVDQAAEISALGDLGTLAQRHPQRAMDLARTLATN